MHGSSRDHVMQSAQSSIRCRRFTRGRRRRGEEEGGEGSAGALTGGGRVIDVRVGSPPPKSPAAHSLLNHRATALPCCLLPPHTVTTSEDSFPARFGGVHFVNQPWYIHALYTMIRPFLKDKTRKRIFLHGNNLTSLHQLLHPEMLPSEFGGLLPPYDMGTWARTLLGPDYDDDTEGRHGGGGGGFFDGRRASERMGGPVTGALGDGEGGLDGSPRNNIRRSQSAVEPGVLKRSADGEEENMQPLLSLD